MEYLPWLLAVVFAFLAIVVTVFLLREKKARRQADEEHRDAVAKLESEKSVLNEQLTDSETENQRKDGLLELINATHLESNGKVLMYAFDRQNGEQLFGAGGDKLENVCGVLQDVLAEAAEAGELGDADARYSVITGENEQARVYVLNNVTHRYTISDLNREIENLTFKAKILRSEADSLGAEAHSFLSEVLRLEQDKRALWDERHRLEGEVKSLEKAKAALEDTIERSDAVTTVMNIKYFCKNLASFAGDGEASLLFIKTEANLPSATFFGKSREAYLKSCADKIIGEFPDCRIARYSEDSFCCLLAGDFETAAQKARVILGLLAEAGKLISLCNGNHVDENVIEISSCKIGEAENLVFCLDIKAKFDRMSAKFGVQPFDSGDYNLIFEYKNGMEKLAAKKKLKFKYRPIADSATGKVFAYQMIPCFPETPFKSFCEAYDGAILFGYIEELEELLYNECMRAYKSAVKSGLLFNNTKIIINSATNACMTNDAEKRLGEKYYDDLQNLISEITEEVPANLEAARIKEKRISGWGASSIVDCTDDIGYNMARIELLSPDIVRVPASIVCAEKNKAVLDDIMARIKGKAKLLVDGINTLSELRGAIAAGADYLAGEYIGDAENEPPCVADRCMRQIGLVRFGKKKG